LTQTRVFGSSKRENHDSSIFYSRKLYETYGMAKNEASEVVNTIPPEILDNVLCQDSRDMKNIPDSSIHLLVTSPPYNVGKEYDENLNQTSYFSFLKSVFNEAFRVLTPGGRACVNVANVGRKPYIPYHKFVIDTMLDSGFMMRGEIIWDKGPVAGTSTAWGSWKSASNPTLRDVHEYILVFSKDKFSRWGGGRKSTISAKDFLNYTKSVWRFRPESASKVGHPAPFPLELPLRCINLYTFENDVVLDPFCGVGTTCIAAKKLKRHFIGLDINSDYVEKAKKRLEDFAFVQKKLGLISQEKKEKLEELEGSLFRKELKA
jgi:DNA modification methylase